jgi:Pyruvate/2-oxoacid:ferredoxin oxidoreductase gamma subunit
MDNHSLRRAVRAPTQVAMFQVRIHGRGGQSVVTAAELLSVAAYKEDRHAQAFPELRL